MRTRTFVFSFLVHSVVLGVAMVVRLVATTELPDPPVATRFMVAAPAEVPDVPPPPPRAVQSAAPAASQNTIPLKAPESIVPEVPRDVPDTVPIGTGVLVGPPGDPVGDVFGIAPPAPRIVAPIPVPPVRVGSGIRAPQKIRHVAPIYPELAIRAHVDGVVILEALIAEDGSVREVKVLRSKALLDEAAMEAVRQWRFTPTLLNGTPVAVIMTVTVTFNLN